jgi:hypothetical protein
VLKPRVDPVRREEDGGPDDGWAGRDPVRRPRRTTGRMMAQAGRAGPHGAGEVSIWRRRGWRRELQPERTMPGATAGGDGAESGGAGCRGGGGGAGCRDSFFWLQRDYLTLPWAHMS